MEALIEAWESKQSREDSHAARVMWAVFAARGVRRKDGAAFTISDFMPEASESPQARKKREDAQAFVAEERLRIAFRRLSK